MSLLKIGFVLVTLAAITNLLYFIVDGKWFSLVVAMFCTAVACVDWHTYTSSNDSLQRQRYVLSTTPFMEENQTMLNIIILAKGGKTPSNHSNDLPPNGSVEAGNEADVVIGVDARNDDVVILKGNDKVSVKLFT